MHIRKFLFSVFLSLLSASSAWAASTADKVVFSQLSLDPGGESAVLTVSLRGASLYSAFEMDITLPEGVSICSDKEGRYNVSQALGASGIFPSAVDELSGELTYSHVFGFSYGVIGENVLRVSCFSTMCENLKAAEGVLFRLKVQASPYAVPRLAEITTQNVHLITADAVQYDLDEAPVGTLTVTPNGTVPIAIAPANQYSTCVLPFTATELPEGMGAYSCCEVDGNELLLVKSDVMEAFTPYILYAEDGIQTSLSGIINAENYVKSCQEGYLHGVLTLTNVFEGFLLQNQGEGAKFYMVTPYTYALPAGRCFLKLPVGGYYLNFRRVESTMNHVEAIGSIDSLPNSLYNLQGERVMVPHRGSLYIQNGKKIIIK